MKKISYFYLDYSSLFFYTKTWNKFHIWRMWYAKESKVQFNKALCFLLVIYVCCLLRSIDLANLFPELAERFSVWETAYGWQREIALWNVGLILSIAYTFLKRKKEFMKILTLQSSLLCWGLGFNHLTALFSNFCLTNIIHILGVLEVMLLGGIWGTILLIREK